MNLLCNFNYNSHKVAQEANLPTNCISILVAPDIIIIGVFDHHVDHQPLLLGEQLAVDGLGERIDSHRWNPFRPP